MNGAIIPVDDNYNHLLCVYLPILHLFLEENDLLDKDIPIYYEGPYRSLVRRYSKNILSYEDAPENCFFVQYDARCFEAETNKKIRDFFMDNASYETKNQGIIIKRENRKISNYNEVLSVLEKFNVSLIEVDFAKMSIDEQIKISNESKLMFGIHGAGFTNLMFMKPEAKIIEYDPFDWPCYELLAKNLDMKNHIRICQPITKNKEISEIEVDIKKLEESLNFSV